MVHALIEAAAVGEKSQYKAMLNSEEISSINSA